MKTYYDLDKALEKPKNPKKLCLYLDRENTALLGDLDKLTNLKELSIQDNKRLEEFPTAILKLRHLESLKILDAKLKSLPKEIGEMQSLIHLEINNVPLETLPETIGTLKNLVRLKTTRTKLKKLPNSISKLSKLTEMEFWKSKLETLPKTIGDLKALQDIRISSPVLKKLPESFGQLLHLKSLMIMNSALKKLPKSFVHLQSLQNVYFGGNQLTSLPKGVEHLTELRAVFLEYNDFKTFPVELCNCPKVEILGFNKNQLTSLPDELEQLKNLRTISLEQNDFKSLPDVLLDWGTTFALNAQWSFTVDPALYYNSPIEALLNKKVFKALPRAEKVEYFKIYTQNRAEIATVQHLAVRKALNAKINAIADHALTYLTANTAETFKEQVEVLICGKTTTDLTSLKSQMATCGLKYVTKISPSTTHVLVSARGNKKLDRLPEVVHWNWMTERQLLTYMDQVQPSFLVEEPSKNESIDRVQDLIMSLSEENMTLALELIEGGGFPDDLLTEVFIIYELSENEALRKKAKKILQQKAGIAIQQLLRKRTSIRTKKTIFFERDYQEIKNKLKSYTDATELDFGKLAFASAMSFHVGYADAIDAVPLAYGRRLVEDVLLQKGNIFDLDYYEKFEKFPLALLDYPDIKVLKLYVIKGFNDANYKWQRNRSFKIPPEIATFQNLEELHVYGGVLEDPPIEAICQLKNLKVLALNVDKKVDCSAFEKALPDCNIRIY